MGNFDAVAVRKPEIEQQKFGIAAAHKQHRFLGGAPFNQAIASYREGCANKSSHLWFIFNDGDQRWWPCHLSTSYEPVAPDLPGAASSSARFSFSTLTPGS